MKKILFLTDFSPNASNAFDYVYHFYQDQEVRLDLFHIVPPIFTSMGDIPTFSGNLTNEKLNVAKDIMSGIEEKYQSKIDKTNDAAVSITTSVEIGSIIPLVKAKMEEEDYHMIALGTRGENKSKIEKWIGTVSSDIIDNIEIPILLIPQHCKWQGVSSITFGADLDDADPFELWRFLTLLKPSKPIVRWLHFLDGNKKAEEKIQMIKSFYEDRSPGLEITFHSISGKDFANAVLGFIDTHDVSMLCMVKHKKNFFESLFSKGHTEEMASITSVPLMLIQEND